MTTRDSKNCLAKDFGSSAWPCQCGAFHPSECKGGAQSATNGGSLPPRPEDHDSDLWALAQDMEATLERRPGYKLSITDQRILAITKAYLALAKTARSEIAQKQEDAVRASSDGAWLPLLEMFSEKEVLLHGAAGEDAMNVGDVVKIVRELQRWKQIYANACAQVVGLGVPAFGTLEEGIAKLASAPSAIGRREAELKSALLELYTLCTDMGWHAPDNRYHTITRAAELIK